MKVIYVSTVVAKTKMEEIIQKSVELGVNSTVNTKISQINL